MYHDPARYSVSHGKVPVLRRMLSGSVPVWFSAVVAVLLLTTAGAAYRVMSSRVQGEAVATVKLPISLEQIPLEVDGWKGEELSIPETTKIYMQRNFADDYISRRYINTAQSLWADLYVVYCSSRPGGILGHRPGVCYPGNGWIPDGTTTSEIVSRSGRPISCLIHRFHKPAPAYLETVVLSFYVLNGQITLRERDFSGFLGRRPNLSGDPARYVAQVQVSSSYENSVRTAAAQMADTLLAFLPDQDGHVSATDTRSQPTPSGGAADSRK
jgi:hypothetical protein